MWRRFASFGLMNSKMHKTMSPSASPGSSPKASPRVSPRHLTLATESPSPGNNEFRSHKTPPPSKNLGKRRRSPRLASLCESTAKRPKKIKKDRKSSESVNQDTSSEAGVVTPPIATRRRRRSAQKTTSPKVSRKGGSPKAVVTPPPSDMKEHCDISAKKRGAIRGILVTPGSIRKKKRNLIFSPKLEEYGETYSKCEYDRTMLASLQYECDRCGYPLSGSIRYSCPVKGCDFDLCEDCHIPLVVREHKIAHHPRRKRFKMKIFGYGEDDE